MTRLWAKREEQIRGVVESTAGLYGDPTQRFVASAAGWCAALVAYWLN